MNPDQSRNVKGIVLGGRSRWAGGFLLGFIVFLLSAAACGSDSGRIAELEQENAALREQLATSTTMAVSSTTETVARTSTIESATTAQTPSTSATTEALSTTVGAEQLVLGLSAVGLPIADYVAYTEETDPNELLGRPGGYSSKVNFADNRLEAVSDFDIDGGGSVEVFESSQAAQSRYDYVDSITSGAAFLAEYHWLSDEVFLRVSNSLTPQQAAEYEEKLPEVIERLRGGETFGDLTDPDAAPVEPVAAADPLASPSWTGQKSP